MKRYIDMDHYPRKSHFEYFGALAYPYVGITANVDVTNAIRFAREKGGSTFLAILYVAVKAANAVAELRQRIEDGKIVEYDYCDIGYTVALEDHTFCNCYTDSRMSIEEFFVDAKRRQEEAKHHPGFVNPDEDETGLIFASCLPWVAFTQCVQPVPSPADCNPRIVFGKYIREGEKTLMPLHIQCNHALVDGYHLSEFYRIFQEMADAL
jgi:chloramphenicol O-acetyltransferase type A